MKKNLDVAAAGSKCFGEGGKVFLGIDEEAWKWQYVTLSNAEVQANCVKYGRLYDWATAMALPSKCNSKLSTSDAACAISAKHRGICPSGWHIPSGADWDILVDYAGGWKIAGKKLKAKSGWNDNGNGTDDFGFSALPGGYSDLSSGFSGSVGGFRIVGGDPVVGGGDGYPDRDAGFLSAGSHGDWWSATEDDGNYAYYRSMLYLYEYALWDNYGKDYLFSVRCLQD
jgi:uncharacterized protein (TIGR02145 family)